VGSLAGGVLADRFERRRIIQLARSAAGLGFLVLGVNALLATRRSWPSTWRTGLDGLAGGVSGTR